jgi:hypothetical protein
MCRDLFIYLSPSRAIVFACVLTDLPSYSFLPTTKAEPPYQAIRLIWLFAVMGTFLNQMMLLVF